MVRWETFEPKRHGEAVDDLVHRVEQRTGHQALTDAKSLGRPVTREYRSIVGLEHGAPIALLRALWYPGRSDGDDGRWAAEYVSDERVDLLDQCLAFFRSALPDSSSHVVWARLDDVADALLGMGYVESRRLLCLERTLPVGGDAQVTRLAAVGSFSRGDDELAWLEVNNRAFSGHPENGAWTLDVVRERMNEPWFDPQGLLMAWRGDTLLGSCWTRKHDSECGEIYVLSVDPGSQGMGIGRALLLAGLDDLHTRQGCTRCILYVDEANLRAVSLYRDLGFSTTLVNRMFELTPASASE